MSEHEITKSLKLILAKLWILKSLNFVPANNSDTKVPQGSLVSLLLVGTKFSDFQNLWFGGH